MIWSLSFTFLCSFIHMVWIVYAFTFILVCIYKYTSNNVIGQYPDNHISCVCVAFERCSCELGV